MVGTPQQFSITIVAMGHTRRLFALPLQGLAYIRRGVWRRRLANERNRAVSASKGRRTRSILPNANCGYPTMPSKADGGRTAARTGRGVPTQRRMARPNRNYAGVSVVRKTG